MKNGHDERLETAIRQVAEFAAGGENGSRISVEEVDIEEVTSIRRRANLSQADFAELIGISVATLRNWEQGRRQPTGPARKLLLVLSRHPEAVLELRPAG